ncbi:hypothetical protein L596_017958 [Steinernema carpocapsae]|uniref:Uncharacterized protein n=1 Tax=Steinernema carpocapsae TaxID=34508 RepID=A0A4U5N376_STECR|nr:hypothetical protein L596_017958 [Steinernema carpocapsae]
MLFEKDLAVVFLTSILVGGFTEEAIGNRNSEQTLSFTYIDHGASRKLELVGQFYKFEEVEDGIKKIEEAGLDWCGFGLLLKKDRIEKHWSPKKQKEFERRLKDSSCTDLGKNRLFSDTDPETSDQNSEGEDDASSTMHLGIIITLAVVLALLVVAIIVVLIWIVLTREQRTKKSSDEERASSEEV